MPRPLNLLLFASHYAGAAALRRLLDAPRMRHVRVRIVATDDPDGSHCNAQNRLWKYGGPPELRTAVRRLAEARGIPVETGPVATAAFARRLTEMRIDAALSAVFGQKIPNTVLDPLGGRAWNIHPASTDRRWPSCTGATGCEQILESDATEFRYVLHRLTAVIDGGPLVRASGPIPIPPGRDVLSMNRDTAEAAADLIEEHLAGLPEVAEWADAPVA